MHSKAKIGIVIAVIVGIVVVGGYTFRHTILALFFSPTASVIPTQKPSVTSSAEFQQNPEVVVENLTVPWEIGFLPDGALLLTERPGTVLLIEAGSKTPLPIQGVIHRGEGGLLGMALHPNFTENSWLYLYLTTQGESGLVNRVERYTFDLATKSLTERTSILENIPGAANHDGGRIAFGPDGYLYITTGDAQNEALAQDTNSLAGKILRIAADGSIPEDNPFGTAVYSYGHRNPQGLAWDADGRLWATEHGPSGTRSGFDEVNLIEKGANYGWPKIKGQETAAGMQKPIIESGASETWAPAGAAIIGDRLFFTGLRGETLYSARIGAGQLEDLLAHFREAYGRLRLIKLGPDGWLYFGTSNTDGRGQKNTGDDKIFRVRPEVL